jgi:Zn-finger nucleic acid-binding protein
MEKCCPRCGSRLTERQFGSVTLDGCNACGGLWFDYQELNTLTHDPEVGLMEVERTFQPAVSADAGQGDMRCPKCNIALQGFSFPHTPNVALDACPHCKGIWVDDGELQAIAERIAACRPAATVSPRAQQSQDEHLREQARMTTAFLISAPCPNCKTTNPAASLSCWACGHALKTRSIHQLCPRCDRPMEEVHPGSVPTHIDACLCCKGVYFGAGELSVFLSAGLQEVQRVRTTIGDGLGAYVDREVYENNTVRCPKCHHGMEQQALGADSSVMIDVCPYCKGVWLDAGELVKAHELMDSGDLPGIHTRHSDSWGTN